MPFRCLLWMSVGTLVSAAVPSLAAERTDFAVLMVAFDQMALRENGAVTKWSATRPLKFKVATKFGDKETAAVDYTLKAIEAETKLSFVRNDDEAEPDIVIELSKEDLSAAFRGFINAGGLTRARWSKYNGDLRTASIAIKHDWYRGDPYYIHRVVPHEMMHAIGFSEHAQGFDSISSYHAPRASYSEWDHLFMRVLYDPRLKPGTPRVFALPAVCRILHERLLAEKNQLVPDLSRDGSPHPYCEELAKLPLDPKKDAMTQTRIGWAYLRGLGVARDEAEGEKWLRLAATQGFDDAQKLVATVEQSRAKKQVAAVPAQTATVPQKQKVDFKPAEPGTTFKLTRGSLRVDRIEGTTVHTVAGNDAAYRWAGMFFGRGSSIPVDPTEATAAPAIWPLEIGKSVEFDHGRGVWKNVIKVLRTEEVKIGERPVLTYVVERRVTKTGDGATPPYEGVYMFWYAPELGFPARYQSRFTGETNERPASWTVSEVLGPTASR